MHLSSAQMSRIAGTQLQRGQEGVGRGREGRGELSPSPGAGSHTIEYVGPFIMPCCLILFDDDWFGIIQSKDQGKPPLCLSY